MGGLSSVLDRPHTPLQPHQAQPIFSAGPAVLWVCHSELGVGLSSAASTEHRAPVPPAHRAVWALAGCQPWARGALLMRDVSTDRQPREPWGGLSCTASTTETEMLQPPGNPGELQPPAPPLNSHLAEGREYKSGRTSDLTQGQQLLPTEDNSSPKCTGTPFLRGGCQTSPFSPPSPPPPLLGSTYLPCCLTRPRGAPAYLQGRKEESH